MRPPFCLGRVATTVAPGQAGGAISGRGKLANQAKEVDADANGFTFHPRHLPSLDTQLACWLRLLIVVGWARREGIWKSISVTGSKCRWSLSWPMASGPDWDFWTPRMDPPFAERVVGFEYSVG